MNLAYSLNSDRQHINNVVFSTYFHNIFSTIRGIDRVNHDLIDEYHLQVKFQADMHNVYIRAQRDPDENWVMSQFQAS